MKKGYFAQSQRLSYRFLISCGESSNYALPRVVVFEFGQTVLGQLDPMGEFFSEGI